jgi:DNA polymerase-4
MENIERHILHINIVNFRVAVARALEPRLVSYPVAVATQGRQRRIVLDMSSEAMESGVRRSMLLEEALRKCRDLVVVNPQAAACERAHKAIVGESVNYSPRVETAGPGHVFIDLTGTRRLWGKSMDAAEQMRKVVFNKYKLPSTAGLASSKLVSKIATRVIKPAGFCSVVNGCEQEFMGPLPVTMLPGIDESIIRKILQFNIATVLELRKIPAAEYEKSIGPAAYDIHRIAGGIDDSPVRDYTTPEQSVEERIDLKGQTNDEGILLPQLYGLAERAAAKMRRMGLGTQRIELVLEYSDGERTAGASVFKCPVCGDITLGERFKSMFHKAYTRRVRLSSMEVQLKQLCSPWGQTDLFFDGESERKLVDALDAVRGKFGESSIKFGRGMMKDE